jgi:hypothetical protein
VKSEIPIPLEDSVIRKSDAAKLLKVIKVKDSVGRAHYTKEAPFRIHSLQICVILLDLLTLDIAYREEIHAYVLETFDSWTNVELLFIYMQV